MKKFNFSRSMKTVQSVITANSPVLLVGATITGVIATGVLAAKAGYKARGIIDEAQSEKGTEPLTGKEKVSLTWLCYAAPAVTATSTIASCMGVHLIHTKRHAALAGLYAITSGKLDDYKEEIENTLNGKKQQEFNDRVAQRSVDKDGFINNEVIIIEGGTELCHDDWTGRWFHSNMNHIAAALNEVNAMLVDEGELDLNTFYDRLGLQPIPSGTEFGWQKTKEMPKLTLIYGSVTAPDGRPAISITFRNDPKPNVGRP